MLTARPADETGEAKSRATEVDQAAASPDAGGPILEEGAGVSPAAPRPKRDYNYFADLRKALAELRSAEGGEDPDTDKADTSST